MGAIIMDGTIIHNNTLIAAGAVITENTIVESNSVYAGIPAKKIKTIDTNLISAQIEQTANNYIKYANWYKH